MMHELGRRLRPRLRRKAFFMCYKKELLEYKKQLLNGELYYGGYTDVWNDDVEIHCGKCYYVWR